MRPTPSLLRPAMAVSAVAVASVAALAFWPKGVPAADAASSASATASHPAAATSTSAGAVPNALPGMPPVIDAHNLYSEIATGKLSPVVKGDLERIYVPNLRGNSVSVIDPAQMKVVDTFPVGNAPQHVVPSYDLRTLWAANNAERRSDGSLTPIDPRTGKPGTAIPVDDPYNLYFTPDGASAIVVAEAKHRLDFRDPKTMALQYQIDVPRCAGINHADFTIDGRQALFTCEFQGSVAKIDLAKRQVLGYLTLPMPKTRLKDKFVPEGQPNTEICTSKKGMPQDLRLSPDGKRAYVADMEADGVHVVDVEAFSEIAFIPTGVAAHGLYPSRDGKFLYVSNRGSHRIHGPRNGPGSVTVLDIVTGAKVANWPVPGGGSPDMGGVTADGRWLWLSGRYDDVVYRFDTTNGSVTRIGVGKEPHGLAVWPQPGRYSLGHTGNLR